MTINRVSPDRVDVDDGESRLRICTHAGFVADGGRDGRIPNFFSVIGDSDACVVNCELTDRVVSSCFEAFKSMMVTR